MQIKAAVIREKGGPFLVESLRLEEPRRDEVLVRVAGVGVCHTDLVCRDQYFPVPLPCVLGHEGSGVVEAVGRDVTKVKSGDHVVLSFNSCGRCANCLSGKPAYCLQLYQHNFLGTRTDGSTALSGEASGAMHGHFFSQSSFGTYALAAERNTVKVDPAAPLWMLGPLGCGVQTGAGAVINSLQPKAGSTIAIFGAGTVGLSAIMAARLCGCSVIVAVDPVEGRRKLALELGATDAIDPRASNPVTGIQALTQGGCHHALECTGLPSVVRQAVESLTLTGVCGVIGVSRLGTEITLDMNSILFGRGLRGIIEGDSVADEFIPSLIRLHGQGRFPFDRLIARFAFEDIQKAVEASERGEVVKAVLIMA
jgi:aryl-alcohol dehydrogenase